MNKKMNNYFNKLLVRTVKDSKLIKKEFMFVGASQHCQNKSSTSDIHQPNKNNLSTDVSNWKLPNISWYISLSDH